MAYASCILYYFSVLLFFVCGSLFARHVAARLRVLVVWGHETTHFAGYSDDGKALLDSSRDEDGIGDGDWERDRNALKLWTGNRIATTIPWLRTRSRCGLRSLLCSEKAATVLCVAVLGYCYLVLLAWPGIPSLFGNGNGIFRVRPHASSTNLTEVFQVYRPPADPPSLARDCEVLLMNHTFAFSYGKPFVGSYRPPDSTKCSFNTVQVNLTITSRGRQFDRLALMFLGDVEVFRTSTAEPTTNGIEWTYRKEMTAYLSLWREPQKIIFDLGNLVNDVYTGTFNATLTAKFWEVEEPVQAADLILPISAQQSELGRPSAFSLPADEAMARQSLPVGGVRRAIVSVSACGQATEEFWFSNVLSEDTETFLNSTGELYGFSPFREVQLLIDGYLAGVVWPFPIIFTGGLAPGFWRPVVGIDAFDLREPEIDITPWLPWLSDGEEHRFDIRVVGLESDGEKVSLSREVGDYWVVTGKILIFLGDEQSNTTQAAGHDLPSIFTPEPAISVKSDIEQSANGTNETLSYAVTTSRSVVVTSEAGSWVQTLEFQNGNILTSQGLTQSTTQSTKGHFAAINFGDPRLSFSVSTSYPLSVNTTIRVLENDSGISIDASISRGLTIESTGRLDNSLFTLTSGESKLDTSQFGTAYYSSHPNKSYSFGDTTQDLFESSRKGFSVVHVEAVNGSIAPVNGHGGPFSVAPGDFGVVPILSEAGPPYRSLRAMVGRGPGRPVRYLP
ncbi:hypothetical protein EPUS_04849 [Endocarpon pusillum Z07020]|uniref:Peptide N-acetyl-beta-D-glucosaminyl asparaginase amidase A N-terminal domain-containing protein n=1 Tax=Endocarpon pusillum (strain Z07020 / HMAS-L-300199) TaxID=1263415 RepID=U1GBY0_ENDPU|nr:uncharacterized protein EPUS_04849 [Endocarpon pusillum Z07020]ERF75067.1 hypothetical protein EPUS_04849 [Endocarpon pusillum Z07020]